MSRFSGTVPDPAGADPPPDASSDASGSSAAGSFEHPTTMAMLTAMGRSQHLAATARFMTAGLHGSPVPPLD